MSRRLVLAVGLDWAEKFHDVALGLRGGGDRTVPYRPRPFRVARLSPAVWRWSRTRPNAGVLETRHGLLVEALLDAGFTVLPVNPDLVARRRGPAKKKDEPKTPGSAPVALDQYSELRQLIPHGELGAELRAIARDDDRAARDERRLANRLRADLLAVFPAAIDIADGDLALNLLQAAAAVALGRRSGPRQSRRYRRAGPFQPSRLARRFTDRVLAALAATGCRAPRAGPAKIGTIRLAAAQLLLLREQRRIWQRRMGEILLGSPRYGRAKQPKDPHPGNAFPSGEIYLSILASVIVSPPGSPVKSANISSNSPRPTRCNATPASPSHPPLRRSEYVVARRLAYNRYLGNAVQQWAFCSLHNPHGPAVLRHQNRRRQTHHTALRTLGNRWLEILWHCLRLGVTYNEAIHTANRTHSLKPRPEVDRGCLIGAPTRSLI